MTIVDTCVWSFVFRRHAVASSVVVDVLRDLIKSQSAYMIGSVRQEVLSGIKEVDRFVALRDQLRSFPDVPTDSEDHERAAEFDHVCRRSGIAASPVDLLICAIADRYRSAVLTTDQDFIHYQKVLPITLFPCT